jgi:hypothetical protein
MLNIQTSTMRKIQKTISFKKYEFNNFIYFNIFNVLENLKKHNIQHKEWGKKYEV